jgi:hypothetical protein
MKFQHSPSDAEREDADEHVGGVGAEGVRLLLQLAHISHYSACDGDAGQVEIAH